MRVRSPGLFGVEIKFRADPALRDELAQAAATERTTLSDFARRALRRAVSERADHQGRRPSARP
jgi:uncharacterized protein (DUF1778 family)